MYYVFFVLFIILKKLLTFHNLFNKCMLSPSDEGLSVYFKYSCVRVIGNQLFAAFTKYINNLHFYIK